MRSASLLFVFMGLDTAAKMSGNKLRKAVTSNDRIPFDWIIMKLDRFTLLTWNILRNVKNPFIYNWKIMEQNESQINTNFFNQNSNEIFLRLQYDWW